MPGTEVDAAIPSYLQRPVGDQMDARSLELIKNTVAKGLDDAELYHFLQMAAHLGLNPFAREIWAGKGKTRDGKPGRVLIMVGRDGLLKKAREHPLYRGFDSDVVHGGDTFERVAPQGDAVTLRERAGVVHTYGHPGERGPIIGAWCVVDMHGRPPRFYYASMDEYAPSSASGDSAWGRQPSAMIEKCALSHAHRTAVGISGVVTDAEAAHYVAADAEVVTPADVEIPWPEGELGERLRAATEAVNAVYPNCYTPAVLQMQLAKRDAQGIEAYVLSVESAAQEAQADAAQLAAQDVEPEPTP